MLGTVPDGEILQLSENRLAVYYSGNSIESGFYLLTKTSVEELPKMEIIVFAVFMPDSQLEQFVMKFNRSSDRYHVSLEYYQGEEGKDRLDAKIVSGNPPDLIELSNSDVIKYARKNFLEDLAPYLEQSNVLEREDFLDTILDAYTIKGKMVCIPREFLCSTVIGRKSQVGSVPGWTPEDVRNLVGMYPQMELFHNVGLHALVKDFFGPYILEQYIDWDSGECSFDREGFVDFMEWVAALSEGTDTEEWYFETMTGTMDKGRLLSVYAPVDKLYALVRQEIFFQEKVTAMGYPSVDGSPYHYGETWNRIGILANSNQKEGAWQFLEAFLADTSMEYTFLPNRKSLLQKNATELTMPDYVLDAEGEKILDRSGHPLVSPKIILFGIGNGDGRVNVDYMTQEQIDQVYQVIAATDFTPGAISGKRSWTSLWKRCPRALQGARPSRKRQA